MVSERPTCTLKHIQPNFDPTPPTTTRSFLPRPLTTCPPSSFARFRLPLMLLMCPGAPPSSLSPYLPHGSGKSLRAFTQPTRQGGATQTSQPQATGTLDMGKIRFSPNQGELEGGTSALSAHCPTRPSDATASSIPSIPPLSRSHSSSSSTTCASSGALSTLRSVLCRRTQQLLLMYRSGQTLHAQSSKVQRPRHNLHSQSHASIRP